VGKFGQTHGKPRCLSMTAKWRKQYEESKNPWSTAIWPKRADALLQLGGRISRSESFRTNHLFFRKALYSSYLMIMLGTLLGHRIDAAIHISGFHSSNQELNEAGDD
jgi:hypothetical protein